MPGYETSILDYDGGVMLNIDVAHKFLRSDTMLDIAYDLYHRFGDNYFDEINRKFIGAIVLTRFALTK